MTFYLIYRLKETVGLLLYVEASGSIYVGVFVQICALIFTLILVHGGLLSDTFTWDVDVVFKGVCPWGPIGYKLCHRVRLRFILDKCFWPFIWLTNTWNPNEGTEILPGQKPQLAYLSLGDFVSQGLKFGSNSHEFWNLVFPWQTMSSLSHSPNFYLKKYYWLKSN